MIPALFTYIRRARQIMTSLLRYSLTLAAALAAACTPSADAPTPPGENIDTLAREYLLLELSFIVAASTTPDMWMPISGRRSWRMRRAKPH